jgi:hypothetical protein
MKAKKLFKDLMETDSRDATHPGSTDETGMRCIPAILKKVFE